MENLEEDFQIERNGFDVISQDHPDRIILLNILKALLGDRYSRTRAMTDLEESIQIARNAVDATPEDHPDRAGRLNNLGAYLGSRYSRTGAMTDLEEANQMARDAVNATPKGYPNRAGYLHNLGTHLNNRYSRTGAMADLEEAIQVARNAVDATPKDHPDRAKWLSNLGAKLGDRYSRTGAITDLEESIQIARNTVDATPQDHPDRVTLLHNLGNRLGDRYLRTGAMEDLEEAIQITRDTVDATPEDHPDRASQLHYLGAKLGDRYSRTGAMADLEEAKTLFLIALNLNVSPVRHRLQAGRRLLLSSTILQDIQEAYEAAQTAIRLIPLLTPRSLQNTDKQHLLSQAAGLASDAAAIALAAGKGSTAAIEMLETGRGVLVGTLYDMRTDLSALEQQHPDLARSFYRLRDILDAPTFRDTTLTTTESLTVAIQAEANQRRQAEANQRREAGQQLETLIGDIRSQPGFERFLFPPLETEMQNAAKYGPIVIINISMYRCDALIIEPSGIRVLELDQVSRGELDNKDPQSHNTFVWLWSAIVSPILEALGFTQTPSGTCWPRVWWIPTGPLVRFPLHAAGDYLNGNSDTAVDKIISSYSSSIRAIIHSRQQPYQKAAENEKIALVAMNDTPEQSRLPFADEEIGTIQAVCQSMGVQTIWPERCKKEVLLAIKACQIFHFAGHGGTDPASPLHSQLLLDDWKKDPLTVESLLAINLGSALPFLAYLSACGTGENRNEELADEGIHLTAAYQIAGFRHVIGTLWSVSDRVCVDMARRTYEVLRDQKGSDQAVSSGLHRAMRDLRDVWVREENARRSYPQALRSGRDAEVCDSIETRTPFWVPYVHFGV